MQQKTSSQAAVPIGRGSHTRNGQPEIAVCAPEGGSCEKGQCGGLHRGTSPARERVSLLILGRLDPAFPQDDFIGLPGCHTRQTGSTARASLPKRARMRGTGHRLYVIRHD